VPIVELVDYIIDEHFPEAEKRRQLHAEFRNLRKQWEAEGRSYTAIAGRVGTLYLQCKNAACAVLMETPYKATQGMIITCPPCELSCPACGHLDTYDGSDLQLVFPKTD